MYGDLYYQLYGYIFALQLLFCLIVFIIYQPRKNYFPMRTVLCVSGYFILVTATWGIIRLINDGTPEYSPIYFILVTIYLAVAIFFSFRTNVLGAVYFATGAYAVQHTAYSVGNIIRYLFSMQLPAWADILIFDFIVYCVVGAIFFLVFVWPRRHKFASDIYDGRAFVISFCIILICILLSYYSDNIFAEYLAKELDVRNMRIFTSIYAAVSCVAAIVIQFGFLKENKLTDDNAILDHMMQTEKKHHELSKETIDIINTKCHDLKHQLALLEQLDDKNVRKAYIDELSECIAFYDSTAQTGNDALDIVLSEKGLLCEKNDIAFSCLADGAKLSFMSATDIASLFGNALDNAIEKELTESDERRFISLSVKEEKGFIYIHIDNYCSGELEFIDGLPQTTKPDKIHHGFGTKSISNIVYKYSGELIMSVEDDRFNLDILFPADAQSIK